ncbi:NAD(P)/FAD-dependent oxidoreductase [Yersinia similis]|uniref:NAD(P)/FAD-dependent oxidoreductase n=1 Tax=Yersinia similis TaxID=367190 RepID=UPI0011A6130D|nr:FAD-dependent oxidoreductase [Yersinia similis]
MNTPITADDAGIVIIGGGQAGGWAAKTLRDEGYTGPLAVVSDEDHDFYERPPLSKAVLLDQSDEPELSRLFCAETVDGLNINWHRPLRVESILPNESRVLLNNGQCLPYRQLLIATGSRPRFPAGGWASHPQVMALRSWNDALKLRTQLRQCRSLAIVGGGWIGLEIAASARKLGIEVTVFERQGALCMRSVGGDVSAALMALHQQQGVEIHCDCGEIALRDDGNKPNLQSAITAPKTFDLVVVGIGVELNVELARAAGLVVETGIVVDLQGRTSDPAIFAAGDVAAHPTLGVCLQSWAYAQNQAIVTARAMLNAEAAGYSDAAWLWSDQYDCHIQILGIPALNSQQVIRRSETSSVFFFLNDAFQLVQMVAFNEPRAIKLGKRWLASGRVLDPVQLSDPDFSLMNLK